MIKQLIFLIILIIKNVSLCYGSFSVNNYTLIPVPIDNCGETFKVEIYWTTGNEFLNDYFTVQRSTDPNFSSFTNLSNSVNSCGTCIFHDYSYTDIGPFSSGTGITYYYRLKGVNVFIDVSFENIGQVTFPIETSKDWSNQVAGFVNIATTPSTSNSYIWHEETNVVQGISIDLIPTEIASIYAEENNFMIQFYVDPSFLFTNLEVSVDNLGYNTIYNGSSTTYHFWEASQLFIGQGEHFLQVKFMDFSGTEFYREYNILITPKADRLFKDNFCNVMRVWNGNDPTNGIPLLWTEGYDPYNVNGQQFHRYKNSVIMDCLLETGFNIYVLNFKYNSQSIVNNAAVVSSATSFISAISNQEVVVTGKSMGGIVCRYALAYAEDIGSPLPVSKFMTFDSPHTGGYISQSLQDWRMDKVDGDAFAEHAGNNDAAKELLIYNSYDASGTTNFAFYSNLSTLNGDGLPHECENYAVAFSNTNPNPHSGVWLKVIITGLPNVVAQDESFTLEDDEKVAGSFLPRVNADPVAASDGGFWVSMFLSGARPFSFPAVKIEQYLDPVFISYESALGITNGTSIFGDNIIDSNDPILHDLFPNEVVDDVLNALIKSEINIQNISYSNTKIIAASNSINVGRNVTQDLPIGDVYVLPNSNIKLIAGNEINLSNEFHVEYGSEFSASIDKINCNYQNVIQHRTSTNSSTMNVPAINSTYVDEKIIYSNGINMGKGDNNVFAFMNNSTDIAYLNFNGSNKTSYDYSIELINLEGKLLYSQNNINTSGAMINMSMFVDGLYFIRITDKENSIIKKIIKY